MRTSNIGETPFVNEDVLQNLNITTDILNQNNDHNIISIPVPNRVSCDKKVNNYGRRMMEFCKTFGINILNGQYGTDKDVGHLTCKYAIVLDYF